MLVEGLLTPCRRATVLDTNTVVSVENADCLDVQVDDLRESGRNAEVERLSIPSRSVQCGVVT